MPWKETDVKDQRIEFVVRARRGDASISGLCREFGISRTTGHKWLGVFARVGSLSELDERSRRPRSSPGRTPPRIEERLVQLRAELGWGSRKLQCVLRDEGIHLARSTINQVLRRHGVKRLGESRRPATKRFERSAPNELAQMDFKGEYRLANGGWCHPLSLVDDYSRFSLGLYALPSEHGVGVQAKLVECFTTYGVPSEMLVDHGTPWWVSTNGHGLTRLSVWLIDQGIRLRLSGVGHPQTQGKVERFHRTLHQAIVHWGQPSTLEGFRELLERFRSIYNERRPHEALGMQVPASRYRPSSRPYLSQPPPWTYPPGTHVTTLNTAGCLSHGQRRYFVSEALAGKQVGYRECAGLLLVSYRHMHLREIHVQTGVTRQVVEPVSGGSSTSFASEKL